MVYAKLLEDPDISLYKSKIRQDVSLMECTAFSKSVFEYAEDSRGAADFKVLVKKLSYRISIKKKYFNPEFNPSFYKMAKKSFSNDLLRDLHSETLSIDLIPNFNEPIELSALNSAEQEQLNLCETIIEKGCNTFIEVGNALFEIRNNKLYLEKHSTLEEYCKQKW